MAFVNVRCNEGPNGCTTDIDGNFVMHSQVPIVQVTASFIGYKTLTLSTAGARQIQIELEPTSFNLMEIEVSPGTNPAWRIIGQAVANRIENDHQHLGSFKYTSYEKMAFMPETDSIPLVDSLLNDTSYMNARDFFGSHYIFLMETVNQRSFRYPGNYMNKVIATRISGMKDPLFVMMMSDLQSTTFYTDLINILGHKYINPLTPGSTHKYHFELVDTLIEPPPYDTIFTISFTPLPNTRFDGLNGIMHISSQGYALQSVSATPADTSGMSVKIEQRYSLIDSVRWFPSQLNTEITFQNIKVGIDKNRALKIRGSGRSYISAVEINPALRKREFGLVETDISPTAHQMDEGQWQQYRNGPLSDRELNTYHYIDSVGNEYNLDRKAKMLQSLLDGKVDIGYTSLYLADIVRINQEEGFRLGLHFSTNDKISRVFQVGGYGAYGFGDKDLKYGADLRINLNRYRRMYASLLWAHDVDEAGADVLIPKDLSLLSSDRLRGILVDHMDASNKARLSIGSLLTKEVFFESYLSNFTKIPLYEYGFQPNLSLSALKKEFTFTEAGLILHYRYGQNFAKSTNGLMTNNAPSLPGISLAIAHGFKQFLSGGADYNRLDVTFNGSKQFRYIGRTSLSINAGMESPDVPYCMLYTPPAAYNKMMVYGATNFMTMRYNEFMADRFAAFSLSHDLGRLRRGKALVNPKPALFLHGAYGFVSHPEYHHYISVNDYRKGYYESGLVLAGLLDSGLISMGLATAYRLGPYNFSRAWDNFAFGLAFDFSLTGK